jgi:hypothetical protein
MIITLSTEIPKAIAVELIYVVLNKALPASAKLTPAIGYMISELSITLSVQKSIFYKQIEIGQRGF